MTAPIPAPEERLSADAVIASPEDIRIALQELSWLKAASTQIDGECHRECGEIVQRHTARMVVKFGRTESTFAERGKAIEESLKAYCEAHRAELLEGEKKSRDFSHGKIGWKMGSSSLGYVEGATDQTLAAKVEKKTKIAAKIAAMIGKIPLIGKLPLSLFFDFNPSLAKNRIKEALKSKKVTPRQLKTLGLELKTGADEFGFSVHEYPVQREAE